MLLIIGLIVVALAAMAVAVAAYGRPLICCPAAGVASGVLLVAGAELAVAGESIAGLAATVPGLVAGGWGLTLAMQDANRRRADAERAERAKWTDRDGRAWDLSRTYSDGRGREWRFTGAWHVSRSDGYRQPSFGCADLNEADRPVSDLVWLFGVAGGGAR